MFFFLRIEFGVVVRLKYDIFSIISRLLRISANVAFSFVHFSFAFSFELTVHMRPQMLIQSRMPILVAGKQFQILIGSKRFKVSHEREKKKRTFAIVCLDFFVKNQMNAIFVILIVAILFWIFRFLRCSSVDFIARDSDIMGDNDDYIVA